MEQRLPPGPRLDRRLRRRQQALDPQRFFRYVDLLLASSARAATSSTAPAGRRARLAAVLAVSVFPLEH